MELAGVQLHDGQSFGGISLVSLLDVSDPRRRDTLYWHYPQAKLDSLSGRSLGAVRDGDYQLIEFFDTNQVVIYDLRQDIGESNKLAVVMPDKVAALRTRLSVARQHKRMRWKICGHSKKAS
jgi:arylsulfatase A